MKKQISLIAWLAIISLATAIVMKLFHIPFGDWMVILSMFLIWPWFAIIFLRSSCKESKNRWLGFAVFPVIFISVGTGFLLQRFAYGSLMFTAGFFLMIIVLAGLNFSKKPVVTGMASGINFLFVAGFAMVFFMMFVNNYRDMTGRYSMNYYDYKANETLSKLYQEENDKLYKVIGSNPGIENLRLSTQTLVEKISKAEDDLIQRTGILADDNFNPDLVNIYRYVGNIDQVNEIKELLTKYKKDYEQSNRLIDMNDYTVRGSAVPWERKFFGNPDLVLKEFSRLKYLVLLTENQNLIYNRTNQQ